MASYNGIKIALNQPGVDALRDLADALPGAKDDLSTIALRLRKAINQYGTGLGVKKGDFDEIVCDYEKIISGIGDVLDATSGRMRNTADMMQDYIDTHDDHGPMTPKTKTL